MADENKTEILQVLVSPDEKRLIELAAEQEQRSVSNFVRSKIIMCLEEFKTADKLEKKEG